MEHQAVVQRLGLAERGFEARDEPELDVRSRLGQFVGTRPLALESSDDRVGGLLDFGQGVAGARRDDDGKCAGFLLRIRERRDISGELLVVHELLVEARGARGTQHLTEIVERGIVGIPNACTKPLQVQPRHLHTILEHEPLLTAERVCRHRRARNRLPFRQACEVLRHQRLHLRGLEVTDNRHRGVGRRVVQTEEVLHVLHRCLLQLVEISHDRPRVGIRLGVDRGGQDLERAAVRLVVDTLPAFVLHDVALCNELCRVELVEQEPHAVGFNPEDALEIVGRDGLIVVRAVVARGAVVRHTADPFGQPVVQAIRNVQRAGEHHVLEHVRESRVAQHLVLAADVVPDVHGDLRRGVIWREDDVETVREREPREGNPDRVRRLCGCRRFLCGEGRGSGNEQDGDNP